MILEGIVTTLNPDGSANISPMGPQVEPDLQQLVLRPYRTSATLENLLRHPEGVFHVTDNVELLARAAVDCLETQPPMHAATAVRGVILSDACRWLAFRVRDVDTSEPRARLVADVVDRGHIREFFGLNRAKHAVVEAAILATRTQFLPKEKVVEELERLVVLVEKTGGPAEQRAFAFLVEYIQSAFRESAQATVSPAAISPTSAPR